MINLEQVKLLETKVAKAIDCIERLAGENASLRQSETELRTKLESYQKRNDELEVLVLRFKEDQGKIEDAILAALDRFNQFEEAVEKSLWDTGSKTASKESITSQQSAQIQPASSNAAGSNDGKVSFEIPLSSTETDDFLDDLDDEPEGINDDDIADPLDNTLEPLSTDSSPKKNGELDIF